MRYSFMTSFYSKKADRWLPSPKIENVESEGWIGFVCDLLQECEQRYNSKVEAPLISPAFYDNVLYRKNENVSGWSFLCLDFDSGVTMDAITKGKVITQLDLSYFAFHTASSTKKHEKFRLILPVDREIRPAEIPNVWNAAYILFNKQTDKQCSDLSRGYYVPWGYDITNVEMIGTHFRISGESEIRFHVDGETLNVDHLKQLAPLPKTRFRAAPSPRLANIRRRLTKIDERRLVKEEWKRIYYSTGKDKGGYHRAFFQFLIKIVGRAKLLGLALDETKLIQMARELDQNDIGGPYYTEEEYSRQAQNAIRWGASQ